MSRTVCPTLDEISRQFFAALEEARINRQQNKNTAESGDVEVQYSRTVEEEYAGYDQYVDIDESATLRTEKRLGVSQFSKTQLIQYRKVAYELYKVLKEKSPFFRAWFGDWLEYSNAPLNTTAFIDRPIYDLSIVPNKCFNAETGWEIKINSTGFSEVAAKEHKWSHSYHALHVIDNIIENAILLDAVTISNPSKKIKKRLHYISFLFPCTHKE